MKKTLLFLIVGYISASFGILNIDEYSVIKVIGSIKHAKNNSDLYTGDKVYSNEKLSFAQKTAKAALISKDKGRFMLSASPSGSVQEGLLPAMANVSSRAGALLNSVDIKQHFSDKYLLLSACQVEINPQAFPMDEKHFFFLRFNYNGENISKKLSFEGTKLNFNKDEILQIDHQAIELKEGTLVELLYRNNEDKSSQSLSVFEPVFVNETMLIKECQLILLELGDAISKDAKKEHLLAYLTENYGKTYPANFNQWIKSNLGL